MKLHLNTLFVTTDGAYLRKKGETVVASVDKVEKLRVPLLNLDGICTFGRVSLSPNLMGACAEAGVRISILDRVGRFKAAVVGYQPGNVLLRRQQYRVADEPAKAVKVARAMVTGKVLNARTVLHRGQRDHEAQVGTHVRDLAWLADRALVCEDMESLRGHEGAAASLYFSGLDQLVTLQGEEREAFRLSGRNRRPPLDPFNALLSFLYAMLAHDTRSACEAAGLDAQVGFLHVDRPGRPSLALDLMEEFRPWLVDRLALSLINRKQVSASGFVRQESGAIQMDDATRRTVITAWQKRKQEEITHAYLDEKMSVGLVVHVQARLLARHLRGDLDAYPPFLWK